MKVIRFILIVLLKAAIAPVLLDALYSAYMGKLEIYFTPIVFPICLLGVLYEEWWTRRKPRTK